MAGSWSSNMVCLWGLCARPACRRARCCRGEPRDCMAKYTPLVPEDAREGVKAMFDGLRSRMTFDEMSTEAPSEIAAVEDWDVLVRTSATRGRPSE